MQAILRLPEVLAARGRKRSTHYLDIKNGLMTRPVSLGQAVGWPENEVAAINAARISGKSDDEIRELVRQLEQERRTAFARWQARNIAGGAG